jgi:hypothetical protein
MYIVIRKIKEDKFDVMTVVSLLCHKLHGRYVGITDHRDLKEYYKAQTFK